LCHFQHDASLQRAPAAQPRVYLQVGAFASRENAEGVAERLRRARIYNVELSPRTDVEPQLWRVRVGPLRNVDEVDAVSIRVADSGFPEARVVID
jgi:rare lipoprotein A